MATVFFKQAKENQKKYKNLNYKPKLIFAELENQFNKLLALSFFLMIMTSEILLNQPIKKKIGLIHNNPIYKFLFRNYEKLERIETNSFAFSFFMILQKLFKEEEALEKFSEELIQYTVCHWVIINKMNEKQYTKKLKDIIKLWNKNKEIVMSKNEEKKN